MDITQLLIEYKSIIGTILGSVTALIVTHSLRHFGRVRFYLNSWKCTFFSLNDNNNPTITNNIDKATYCEFTASIDLFNSSDIPKNLRDAHIELHFGKVTKCFTFRNHKSIKEIVNGEETQKIKIIHLPAKEMQNINLYCNIKGEDIELLKKVNSIYFVAYTENNRVYKKQIADKICR